MQLKLSKRHMTDTDKNNTACLRLRMILMCACALEVQCDIFRAEGQGRRGAVI